jgi:hypothetical protein
MRATVTEHQLVTRRPAAAGRVPLGGPGWVQAPVQYGPRPVTALGVESGTSKSEVSRICAR